MSGLPQLKKTGDLKIKKSSDKYLFDTNDYKVIRVIKRGGFGIIHLVLNKKTKKEYAAKTNLIQAGSQNKLFVSREVRILIKIQHPTIIQFRGFSYQDFNGNDNVTILMDYMKFGSLSDLIEQEEKGLCPLNYDNTRRQIILVGIARGMMVLHRCHVIHRDLKPENILLDNNLFPRITDFGLSKFFDPNNSCNQSSADSGTASYMAPEVITSDHFNTKADVFAFGILMYEVLSGKRAYYDLLHGKNKINAFELKTRVKNGLRPNIDEEPIKESLKMMIKKCWSSNPKERPNFRELFHRLSLTRDDDIIEYEDKNREPSVLDNDEDEDDIIESKKYLLDDVDVDDLFDYLDEICEEPTAFKISETDQISIQNENVALKEEIKRMQSKIVSLETELSNVRSELPKLKENQNKISSDVNSQISGIKRTVQEKLASSSSNDNQAREINLLHRRFGNYFYAELSLKGPGILGQLKAKEKTPFDRLFYVSKSNNDIYNLIDKDLDKTFITGQRGNFTIEFELEEEVTIKILQISFPPHPGQVPISFRTEVDGKNVKTVKDLNGTAEDIKSNILKCQENNIKEFAIGIKIIPNVRGKKIKFIQDGPNLFKGTNYLCFNKMEILVTDEKYPDGVFKKLLEEADDHDPHKIRAVVSSSNYDSNSFHLLDADYYMFVTGLNSWFQVELAGGLVIIDGFRLKRCKLTKMKSYKIICTDDFRKPSDSWITLMDIDEKSEEEHQIVDIYRLPHPSPPVRFVRIVLTGKTWNNQDVLQFFHFDIFGTYV